MVGIAQYHTHLLLFNYTMHGMLTVAKRFNLYESVCNDSLSYQANEMQSIIDTRLTKSMEIVIFVQLYSLSCSKGKRCINMYSNFDIYCFRFH